MKEIVIQLTSAQSDLVFECLAERPFKQVFELIGSLHAQASLAFTGETPADAHGSFCFSAQQLRLTVEALGDLPFNRVNALLKNMHQQMCDSISESSVSRRRAEGNKDTNDSGMEWNEDIQRDQ